MKRALMICFGLLFLVGCAKETHFTLQINEDGTAVLKQDTVMDRAVFEMEANGGEDGDEADRLVTGVVQVPKENKKSTEDEQKKKDQNLAEMFKAQFSEQDTLMQNPEIQNNLTVDVTSTTIHKVLISTFPNLNLLVQNMPISMHTGHRMKLERDENGKFRLTLQSRLDQQEMDLLTILRVELGRNKTAFSLKIVMPGKVLSSTLPINTDNVTECTANASKEDDLNAIMKLFKESIVVVSEPSQLKMDRFPLELGKRNIFMNEDQADQDVPLAAGIVAYRAVAKMVVMHQTHYFPGAEEVLDKGMYYVEPTGCTLTLTLQAPQGRNLLKSLNVALIRALDDKNRELKLNDENSDESSSQCDYGDGPRQTLDIPLVLVLPQSDVRTLVSVEGEAEILTFSKWNEHVIADPKPGETVIDLGDILSGAKLVILPLAKNARQTDAHQIMFKTKITGPKEIQRLHFVLKAGQNQAIQYMGQDIAKPDGQQFVRNSMVQSWTSEQNASLKLVVRYPDDLKREKVKFKVEDVDLY